LRTTITVALCLAAATGAGLTAVSAKPADTKAAKPTAAKPSAIATPAASAVNRDILHVQVILDHLGFSPGMLDGKPGQSMTAALKGFQEARGLPITGEADAATLVTLKQYAAWRPTKTLALTQDVLAGPYYPDIPKREDEQAKLPALGYRTPMEKLSEMFHTAPDTLIALNPGGKLEVGQQLVFPNALPTSRNYDPKLKPEWRQTLTLLNVDANEPKAASIEVTRTGKVLRVLDEAGKLVAQFQVTTGSEHDPLPIGSWKINAVDTNPKFHFNPKLFWDAKPGEKAAMLPAGPNGPVGVVWLDLNKEHYGIHGTPSPENIGRTESHGCVRLANWNAARLAMMVKPGTPVVFKE